MNFTLQQVWISFVSPCFVIVFYLMWVRIMGKMFYMLTLCRCIVQHALTSQEHADSKENLVKHFSNWKLWKNQNRFIYLFLLLLFTCRLRLNFFSCNFSRKGHKEKNVRWYRIKSEKTRLWKKRFPFETKSTTTVWKFVFSFITLTISVWNQENTVISHFWSILYLPNWIELNDQMIHRPNRPFSTKYFQVLSCAENINACNGDM